MRDIFNFISITYKEEYGTYAGLCACTYLYILLYSVESK